jgi:hypothetical protein
MVQTPLGGPPDTLNAAADAAGTPAEEWSNSNTPPVLLRPPPGAITTVPEVLPAKKAP